MKPWTEQELAIVTFGRERGYSASEIAPMLPGRTITEIGSEIARQVAPKEPWRIRYVHSVAEDEPPVNDIQSRNSYRKAMEEQSAAYSKAWCDFAIKAGRAA